MKNTILLFVCFALLTALFFFSFRGVVEAPQVAIKDDKIARGEYIVNTFGCAFCHTPKKMTDRGPVLDESLWLSGHKTGSPIPQIDKATMLKNEWVISNLDHTAHVGPWGLSYSANITSDPTGIGNWTYEHFRKSMQEGKHKGLDNGRMVMPPMPWTDYMNMSDDDLESLYAYLRSVKPIKNMVPTVKTLEMMD